MNALERFHATLDRQPVDRPASWLGIPTTEALPELYRHFGVKDMAGLKKALGDDIWPTGNCFSAGRDRTATGRLRDRAGGGSVPGGAPGQTRTHWPRFRRRTMSVRSPAARSRAVEGLGPALK